jgi:hypothetical protein
MGRTTVGYPGRMDIEDIVIENGVRKVVPSHEHPVR